MVAAAAERYGRLASDEAGRVAAQVLLVDAGISAAMAGGGAQAVTESMARDRAR